MSQDQKPLSLKESFDKVRSFSALSTAMPFSIGLIGIASVNKLVDAGYLAGGITVGATFLAASLHTCAWFDKKSKQIANEAIARQENTPR